MIEESYISLTEFVIDYLVSNPPNEVANDAADHEDQVTNGAFMKEFTHVAHERGLAGAYLDSDMWHAILRDAILL